MFALRAVKSPVVGITPVMDRRARIMLFRPVRTIQRKGPVTALKIAYLIAVPISRSTDLIAMLKPIALPGADALPAAATGYAIP